MGSVLYNTFTYLLIIGIGYGLRKWNILKKEDGDAVAKLVMNLTLPALLLSSSNGISMSRKLVLYMLLGVAINLTMVLCGYLLGKKEAPLLHGVRILLTAGIDVGNFVLPFIRTFFPGEGMIALVTFNVGNTIMLSGGNYVVASKVAATGKPFGARDMVKRLLSSVCFDTYVLILVMAITGLSLPARVMQVVDIMADANIFLVMIMIGLRLELMIDPKEKSQVFSILASRLGGGLIFAGITWLLPIPTLVKVVLSAAYFGPPSAMSNGFAGSLGYKGSLSSQMNVICIFTGMVIITGILMVAVAMGV